VSRRPLHILLLSTYYRPDIASTGVLMTELAEEWVRRGHRVTVVAGMPHYDTGKIWPEYRGRLFRRENRAGVNIRRVYLYVPRARSSLIGRALNYATFNVFSVLAGLAAPRPDLVMTASPPLTNGLGAWLLSRLRGVPYIYNVQDIYPDVAIRLGILTNRRVIGLFRRLETFIYRTAAAVTVIADGFRRNLLAKDVPPDRIHLLPNFIDPEFIRPLERQNPFSSRHDLDDRFVVLFAGNVGLSQGLEHVLETADRLTGEPDILFLIVGNGAAREGLERETSERNLSNVLFLPFQAEEDVPAMYAAADLCLVPLRRGVTGESVPCKVYSIMASATPLLAAVDRDSDTWRFVEESACGEVIEPEQPDLMARRIRELKADRVRREEYGRNGRERVEREFTPRAVGAAYLDLFERLTATSR